jgi:hypothetical protein
VTHIVIFSGRDKAINSRRGSVRCVQRPCGHGVLPVAVQPATNARTRRFAGQFDGTRSPGGCTIDRSNRHRKLSGGVRVPPGAHGYAYARRHRTSSARPPLSLWPVEAEGPAARGHRMVQARGACPTALGASHKQVAHRGCRFFAPAWSSDSLGAHGGDTARKAASTGEVPAIRWMGRLENAVAGGGAAA